MNQDQKESHPSYGMLSFSRVSGNAKFFGSELAHQHYITLTLCGGSVMRDLHREWYFADQRPLFEIRMTNLQFSELITGMNQGSGIPVTIERTENGARPPLPERMPIKEKTQNEMKDKLLKMSDSTHQKRQKVDDILSKKTLNKEDRDTIKAIIGNLFQEIESNIPFALESFKESTDRIVTEAKMEVEGAIQHKLASLGLEAAHMLLEKEKNKGLLE